MSTVLTVPCDSGLQKMLVVDDKYRDYLVIRGESTNGQTDHIVSVVVSKHHAIKLRDELNKFIDGPAAT